eukprot:EG_transcript_24977
MAAPLDGGCSPEPLTRPLSLSAESDASIGSGHSSGLGDSGKNDTNVYVSELPPAISLAKFRALFAPFGVIIAARLVPRRKGHLPMGFVQYTTADAAQAAIAAMHRQPVEGTTIAVRLALRDKDKGISNKPSATLYVANLPRHTTEAELRALFAPHGEVRTLLVFRQPGTGASKGSALVRFSNVAAATQAKAALHCSWLPGHDLPLEVKYAESKRDKELRSEGHARKAPAAGEAEPMGRGPLSPSPPAP